MADRRELLTKKKSVLGTVEWFGESQETMITRHDDTKILITTSRFKPGDQVLLMGLGAPFDGIQTLQLHPEDSIAATGLAAMIDLEYPHGIATTAPADGFISHWKKWQLWDVQALPTATAIELDEIMAARAAIDTAAEIRQLAGMQMVKKADGLFQLKSQVEALNNLPEHTALIQWLQENRTDSKAAIEQAFAEQLEKAETKKDKANVTAAIARMKAGAIKTPALIALLLASELETYRSIGEQIEGGKVADKINQSEIEISRLNESGILDKDFGVFAEVAAEGKEKQQAAARDDEERRRLAFREMELLCMMPYGMLSAHATISRQFHIALMDLQREIGDLIAESQKDQTAEKKTSEPVTVEVEALPA